MGAGLNGAVATIAWLSPADAARVLCSISVQVAMDSILTMETEPDVCPNSRGRPNTATAVMGAATGHPVARTATTAATPDKPSNEP